jgi:hypothetical protein
MVIRYGGKTGVDGAYKCEMCDKISRHYITVKPSILNIASFDELKICRKCAERENGKKYYKEIVENYEGNKLT